jgi:hypothetical protein
MAHDEKSEAQTDNESYRRDLHEVAVSQTISQSAGPKNFGPTTDRTSRPVDHWAHIGQSVSTTLGPLVAARVRGHLFYCKYPPLFLFLTVPVIRNLGVSKTVISDINLYHLPCVSYHNFGRPRTRKS